jgi:hypothetical protein
MKPPHAIVLCMSIALGLVLGGVAPAAAGHSIAFARTANHVAGDSPWATAAGDLNADGRLDLVVSRGPEDGSAGTVGVMLNQGGGTFGARQDYSSGSDPADVLIADLDGDGRKDLVTANSWDDTVSILPGTGAGAFGIAQSYPTGGSIPAAIAAGDVDRDGLVDLVLAGNRADTVAVMFNSPYGFWGPVQTQVGDNPVAVALGDVNRDGRLDAVTANQLAGSVSVLLGNGSWSFVVRADYGVGNQPSDVAIGDLNGDGWPDLATANSDPNTVSVLLNDGTAAFVAPRDYAVGTSPSSVAIGDLNGDSKVDMAAANADDNSVSVLLGNGDGTFEKRRDYQAGDGARSLALADLNGDGRLDLVTANSYDNEVSVLINSPGLCDVQDVTGKKVASARAALARFDCRVGNVVRRYSKSVARGRVILQKPGFGAVLAGGGKIKLIVSLGRKR